VLLKIKVLKGLKNLFFLSLLLSACTFPRKYQKNKAFLIDKTSGKAEAIKYNDSISWKHFFKSSKTAEERLLSEEAKASGFGYGEWLPTQLMPHDESMYDAEENHVEPQKLLGFLKEAIYLSDEEFNYNNIKYQFII
jgi:hypothetical protein